MFFLTKIEELNECLKQLKLEKRQLILAGKKTSDIDEKIKIVEEEIDELKDLLKA
ncbi:hypothetical protein ACFO6R_13750 [Eubacterium multiforme]|uniref:Uncharacterized protein Yka (UPF0111/DUF47 family) n=1 Tax=Eubacterium multiforme TaxID=83339 RepID=A0ABT9UXK1_9FIRM|nr:hypothetical protein [Eubacterium multiforme]MDQ0151049.1 uncharacterized protein Yka (UPF0111/DUF47 family) [Eubacterium multiforme]